ncbi:MAG TPA: thymidine phosphorylase [Pyrinomonadaceae bacterium]|nr:thymidine phosphorylase [Pyrinomonadaceae bacterium]
MRPQDIIKQKRDGKALSDGEIASFINGVCTGAWEDYQITALVMAMFVNEMTIREQNVITREMLNSGKVMDFSDIEAPKADKHSTGGVGDKTSLVIAPALAACGVAVPMISGRGLGHTGGTLDKLEAIPGYNVRLSFAEIKRVMRECGFALAGQTAEIAPADKKLYALRDATATVPYIPLIVASIMSKKLAEGLDALVLDVKTGKGAFIKSLAESKKLAVALCATGKAFGVRTEAIVTDMNEPLGLYVGNALETYECLLILRNETPTQARRTLELSVELAANVLVQCRIEKTAEKARERVLNVIENGAALEKFEKNIELQGGDPRICDRPEKLIRTKLKETQILADKSGFVEDVDSLIVGECVSIVGGGRVKASDTVDHAVGFKCVAKVGDRVKKGETLGVLLTRTAKAALPVSEKLLSAYKISPEAPKPIRLVRARVK